jgi:hypothetical protein
VYKRQLQEGGCGSCAHAEPAATPLLQIQRPARAAR